LIKINEEKKYFKGKFGANDMKLCIIAAKDVPDAIKF
jgi:secreted Zn-dependent insulinase-like peptidase